MSNSEKLRLLAEAEGLFSKLLDDDLTSAEEQQLRELLQSDAAVRQQYAAHLQLHALLHWRQSETFSDALLATAEAAPRAERASKLSTWRSTAWNFIADTMTLSLVISALFISIILLSLALWTVPMLKPNSGPQPATSTDFVARVVRTHQAVWSERSEVPQNRVFDLESNHQIDLTEGFAELRFDSGASVTLQAPCSLVPLKDSSLRLVAGSLNVRIPESKTGFVVETKLADFIDLGTEFGVRVDDGGQIDSQVFDGRIQVVPDSGGEPLLLTEGQAIRITAGGEAIVSSSPPRQEFVRALPRPQLPPPRPIQAEPFDGSGDCQLVGNAVIADGALRLPDGQSHAVIMDAEQTPPLTNAYTIAWRFKVDEIRAQNILVRTDEGGPLVSFSHQLFMRGDGRLVHYSYDGQLRYIVNQQPLQAGRWYHVAIAAEAGGSMQLFIDGAKAAEWSGPVGQLWSEGDRLLVGGESASVQGGGQLPGATGQFDRLTIFSRMLRASEVIALKRK